MYRYTLVVTMHKGPDYTDSGLTEEELKARITAYFKDANSIGLRIMKYEV